MIKAKILLGILIGFSLLLMMPFGIGAESLKTGDSTEKMYLDKHAREFVKSYIQNNREVLYSIRQRSQAAFAITDSVFSQYKLPVQLKYLAVIESELNSNALSPVGAAGPWQLMPKTAQLLGLKMTADSDERTCYDKSTKAAAIYLKDLYSEFGDWLLVLAAYNSGPGAVYRAMRVSGSRNFWTLQNYLPAESRKHVKKFIASFYYFEGQTDFSSGGFAANIPHKAALGNGQQGLFHWEL